MYRWVVLLHVLSVLAFVILHGASAMVFLYLRRQTNLERIKALLKLSVSPANASWIGLGALLFTGVSLGFTGGVAGTGVDLGLPWGS
jgi:uncharacterized membrane protein YoaK (UPF0700 family)